MLASIMSSLKSTAEMKRLDRLASRNGGGLAVVYGRRRIRLLMEWSRRHGGVYTIADQSSAEVQRRDFARVVAERLPGFGDVEYLDWRALLTRLAKDAESAAWRGPLVIDELPFLVATSPELPSLLQRWVDYESERARLIIVLGGSSRQLMEKLLIAGNAPLYGRAREILDLGPLVPSTVP